MTQPTLEQIRNDFAGTTEPWAKDGYDIITQAETEARLAHCLACRAFGTGRAGELYCEHPHRSCRKLIPFILQECPYGLWEKTQ